MLVALLDLAARRIGEEIFRAKYFWNSERNISRTLSRIFLELKDKIYIVLKGRILIVLKCKILIIILDILFILKYSNIKGQTRFSYRFHHNMIVHTLTKRDSQNKASSSI